jgi:hypothetical protein
VKMEWSLKNSWIWHVTNGFITSMSRSIKLTLVGNNHDQKCQNGMTRTDNRINDPPIWSSQGEQPLGELRRATDSYR